MDFSAQPSVMGYGDIPKMNSPSKLQISEELLVLMKCAASYAASEAESPHMSCVYLLPTAKYLEILATNQKILFRARYAGTAVKSAIAFPLPMLGVLEAEGLAETGVGQSSCVRSVPHRGSLAVNITQGGKEFSI